MLEGTVLDLEIWNIFFNKPLISALIAQLSSQLLKVIIHLFKTGKFNFKKIGDYGGFPSAHSAFIIALSLSIAFNEGWDSSLFAICIVLSAIFIMDIMRIRPPIEYLLKKQSNEIKNEGTKQNKKISRMFYRTVLFQYYYF